MQVCY